MTEIPRECVRLAAELRTLRDRHRLTLSVLAAETTYSKSSWQRYLTGRSLAPWPAVRTLCRLANEPEPRLRALWELAESSWNRRGAVAPAPPRAPLPAPVEARSPRAGTSDGQAVTPPDAATTEPAQRRRTRWRTGAAVSAAATLLMVLITLAADG
ncbi:MULTISPECIES: helix-turn-helix transcriptional regulator [unclassified Streptomyces]|uniref:helix-turn-helix domain-containing protein n=1 Tax=unclassified Streptomyces TaxID=2593676 RepID=UPI0027DA0541|nr:MULTISPECIES: helix-turn-helix transcriptional regulator [unclassified Streptomyces]